ncbi:hypothetical protein [Fodinicurvata sp. EGI_FJ10296]|uniref:hypothetical protein n=1 Tax=Fodinicurvata sp. EGI_FJ10296 TaxID=3231908 RepID=UPI0034520889
MFTSGKVLGLALGALTATVAVLILTDPADRSPSCHAQSDFQQPGFGMYAESCFDPRPVSRLTPRPGDRTVTSTADGRGVRIALSSDGGMAILSSVAGSSINRNFATNSAAAADEPGGFFSMPEIVPAVRAHRRDLPVFDDAPARDVVATSPDLAWQSSAHSEPQRAERPPVDDRGGREAEIAQARTNSATTATASSTPTFTATPGQAPQRTIMPDAAGSEVRGDDVGDAAGYVESSGSRFAVSRRVGRDAAQLASLPASGPEGDRPSENGAPGAEDAQTDEEADTSTDSGPEISLKDLGEVLLRAGEHDRFSRLVFDWPELVEYSVEQDSEAIRIIFPVEARIDADGARRRSLSRVRGFEITQTDRGVVLSIEPAGTMGVNTFRLDNRVVIDIQPS